MSEAPPPSAPKGDVDARGLLVVVGLMLVAVVALVLFSMRTTPVPPSTELPPPGRRDPEALARSLGLPLPPPAPAPSPAPFAPPPAAPPSLAAQAPSPVAVAPAPAPSAPEPPSGTGTLDEATFRDQVQGVRSLWIRMSALEVQLLDAGAEPEAARQLRATMLGNEAATRLNVLLHALPGGGERMSEYRTALTALASERTANVQALNQGIVELRNRLFPGISNDMLEMIDNLEDLQRRATAAAPAPAPAPPPAH